MEEQKKKKKINLAVLPASGAGHTPSTIELAKRLLLHSSTAGHLSVSLILTPYTACFASSLSLLPTSTSISIYYLPSIDLPSPQSTDGMADYAARCFQLYTPHIKSTLAATSASALIIDFFATAVIDAADELQIPTYVYIPFNASMLSLVLHLPTLHNEIPVEFHQFHGLVHVPGLPPIPPMSMPSPIMNKKSRLYTWSIYHAQRLKKVRGILVNTFRALEKGAISAMELDESIPPIHPIGPILRLSTSAGERHECLLWLDQQPAASVVFLCFGSMGMMTAAQAGEAAAGIERSGYRFLWIMRLADGENDGFPLGFRERTKEKGMVWEGWVPQVEILGHIAVGGFVTHAGWNSSLESLWYGVPMVAWPMYAEQHLNAFFMATEMGLAAEMATERRREGWVTAEEVERKMRWLMEESEEGREVRERVREMKAASRESVEKGGSSWDELSRLITELCSESYDS